MPRVDAHLHVWRAATGPTPGVSTLVPPQQDVPLAAAAAMLAQHRVDRAVLVQPVFRGEDNCYIADCVRASPDCYAGVCVVDPRVPGAGKRLAFWAGQGFRGVRLRPRLPDEEKIFGDAASFPLWAAAAQHSIAVSILSGPEHLPTIAALAERFAEVPIVIDHLGHPDPAAGATSAPFRQLLNLASHPRVFVKLSGFYHFSRKAFPFPDCWDLIRAVYEHFGPRRLLWGSDYPHVTLNCGYARSQEVLDLALADWSAGDRAAVLGGTALELYWPSASI
ncbi:MAG: amidohydrolase [Pirellulales bacterium]